MKFSGADWAHEPSVDDIDVCLPVLSYAISRYMSGIKTGARLNKR